MSRSSSTHPADLTVAGHPSTDDAQHRFRWMPSARQVIRNGVVQALRPWIRSVGLDDLDTVEVEEFELVSLDVFDTCLGRLVGDPTDVFRLVGRRAPQSVTAKIPGWEGDEWFAQQRIAAERRRRLDDGEVTFDEIWDEMTTSIPDPESRAYLQADELAVEAIVSIGRHAVREFAWRAERSTTLVYLSDMYLDAPTIAALLNAAGFPSAPVMVSSESRLTKRTGAAYDLLCERYAVAPDRVLHVGDNFVADGWAAARAGVRPIIVPTWRPRTTTIAPLPGPVDLDDGVALALAAHSSANVASASAASVEHRATSPDRREAWRCGQAAFGPLQIGFVSWLDESLPENEPALFAGRDMRETLDLFRRNVGTRGNAATAAKPRPTWYLDGSRRAFALAAMANGVTEEDRDVLTAGRGLISERDLWLRLGFDDSDVPVRTADVTPRSFHDRQAMWDSVLKNEGLVLERANAELEEVGRYWSQQGLPLTGRAAYVDLGWRGTVQRLIERCVEALGGNLALDGYYLALLEEPSPHLRSSARGWIVDRGFPLASRIGVEAGIPIWELAFQANEGSTRGYRDGRPVRGPAPTSRTIQDAFQAGGRHYVDLWDELSSALELRLSPGAAVAEPMLRLVNTPTRDEAIVLGKMQHTDQPADVGIQSVIKPSERPFAAPQRHAMWLRSSEWRAGSLAAVGLRGLVLRLASSGLSSAKRVGFVLRNRRRDSRSKVTDHAYTVRAMSSGGERAYRDDQ